MKARLNWREIGPWLLQAEGSKKNYLGCFMNKPCEKKEEGPYKSPYTANTSLPSEVWGLEGTDILNSVALNRTG